MDEVERIIVDFDYFDLWGGMNMWKNNCNASWDNVPIDTKVIVTGLDGSEWKCHFYKKVRKNSILVFRDGKTSWTTNDVVVVDVNNVRLE